MKHFARAERSAGRWALGWNWAAFLHSTGWFCYRRMYGWAVLNFAAPFLLYIGIVVTGVERALGVVLLTYLAAVFIAIPVFADSLYHRFLVRAADRARPPSAQTLIGASALGAGWLAMAGALAIPGYADYKPPATVTYEGLLIAGSLKAPIVEFYEQRRRLPGREEAMHFSFDTSGRAPMKDTESVVWDATRKAIVVTLSGPFQGKRLEWAAQEKDGTLAWSCRPIDLDPKYLSSYCR